jgi:hypothetical protein
LGLRQAKYYVETYIDNSISVTAIEFENATYKVERENILDLIKNAVELGKSLYEKMPKDNLKHFVCTQKVVL